MRICSILLLLAATLGACAHPRPRLQSSVAVPATQIQASSFGHMPGESSPPPSAFVNRMAESATDMPSNCAQPRFAAAAGQRSPSADHLVLSGGSLNGAFGAGFFLGLEEAGGLPAEPRVVTGVSTGALQATFLFLARQPVPQDRDYAWQGGIATEEGGGLPALKPNQSNIGDLALAYSIRREADILRPAPGGGIGMLINGAKGSLAPLRHRLMALISPGTIEAVAFQACRGRKLLVGVTDVDDGYGYALDLTLLALRAYDGNATDNLMTLVRKAYVESLIASSSVPVGAKPVTLRIRDFDRPLLEQHRINLFVDGGARFGVFLQELQEAQSETMRRTARPGAVTMVVNTRLAIRPWHSGDLTAPKKGWLLTTLGLRTVSILENQVYHLSVATIEGQAPNLRMAFISNQNIPGGVEPDDHVYRGTSCTGWHDRDEAEFDPVQFFPRYMACLIDYGRNRGRRQEWNR